MVKIPKDYNISFRNSKKFLRIVTFIGIAFVTFSTFVAFRIRDLESYIIVIFLTIFFIILISRIRKYSFTISNGSLVYTSAFGGTVEILLTEIEDMWIESGITEAKNFYQPPVRLIVKPITGVKQKKFYIHIHMFEDIDVAKFLDVLSAK